MKVSTVVPDARILVLSVGLSETNFMCCADACPVRHRKSREQSAMNRGDEFMVTSSGQGSVARALGCAAGGTKDGSE
jgi:hypothetical protein